MPENSQPAAAPLPLADIHVLDLTIARAGPTAVRQLADWGANVIRVEAPGKDASGLGLGRHKSDFQNLHRNKRCITLDLKTPGALEVFHRLVVRADVLIENFRVGVKDRLGIDYAALSAINPRLVYGSISGFGQDGPASDRPGVDQIVQGMGGLMSITGLPGQGPVRVGVPISDLAAGMYLAIGVMVALHERERTGRGRWVRTSLLEAMIAMLDFQAARYTMDGDTPGQAGNDHPTASPMGVFPTSDGFINISGSSQKHFQILCDELRAPEWMTRPEFATPTERGRNRKDLNAAIGERTVTRTSREWIEALNKAGVPCGPINDIGQTMEEPQVKHLGMAQEVEHALLGRIKIVGQPVRMDDKAPPLRMPAPDQGEHTDAILREIGYSESEIENFRISNVV